MTVIAGIAHRGTVYMAADSLGTRSDGAKTSYHDCKLYRHGAFLMSASGCFRDAQIMRHHVAVERPPASGDLIGWLINNVVEPFREARQKVGAETKFAEGQASIFCNFVGLRGRLFVLDADLHVFEVAEYAVGSGGDLARASLHTSAAMGLVQPRRRLTLALDAACALNNGCEGPYQFERQR